LDTLPRCVWWGRESRVTNTKGIKMDHSTTDLDRFHDYVFSGRLQQRVKEYAMGLRGTKVLDDLARIKVYADSSECKVLTPPNMTVMAWDKVLTDLVRTRLGDMRCCDCQGFFQRTTALVCNVGLVGRVPARVCVHCGSNVTVSLDGELTSTRG